jgi:hypothetical protein
MDEPNDMWIPVKGDPLGRSEPKLFFIGCPLPWLARVLPVVNSKDQLVVALYVYSRCEAYGSKTVPVPNYQLAQLGISRQTKYRAVQHLQQAGALKVEEQEVPPGKRQQSLVITLLW